jgi:hypothetical protein
MGPSESQDKPTFQFIAAIMARTECILSDLDPDVFENAEHFGETTKECTDYTFPMDMPYIAEIQEKDKHLLIEFKKDNHKYELKKIERTLVLTRDGKIYIPTVVRNDIIAWYHKYL